MFTTKIAIDKTNLYKLSCNYILPRVFWFKHFLSSIFWCSLFVFSSTCEINVISFAYLFINTEKRKRIFLTFKTIEYFQNNLMQRDSNIKFLRKPGGCENCSGLGNEPGQWQLPWAKGTSCHGYGVNWRQNPPCFRLHFFMASRSSSNCITRWLLTITHENYWK